MPEDRPDNPGRRHRDRGERRNQPREGRGQQQDKIPRWESRLKEVISENDVRKLIQQGGKLLVNAAEKLGPLFKGGELTTSQIRNIYGMVKKMELSGFNANEFVLLKPKLAYAASRAGKDGARQFADVMTWAIDEVDQSAEKFERFVDFFEAILAYHKAAGGK